jgi:ureidoglycolate dehydrogenase (NAD+)
MAQIVSESVAIFADPLLEFVAGCLAKTGLLQPDAELVARTLVESNLRGIDSHGVARLPHYLNRIRHGSINPRPNIQIQHPAPALARIDGDHGLGQMVMHRATDEAIALARESGAGWATVENSTHCGALAFYGLQIAKANMLGIVLTHSDSMVVPHGAKHAFCGTNPLCLTAPGEAGEDLCLDMATSIVPWNTISNAAMEGVSIPGDWAVDAEGEPTTDPRQVRGVHPFGGYKGSGLGLMIDVFCSALLGSPFGPNIGIMYGDPSIRRHLGGLVGAIDISRFRDTGQFRATIAALVKQWHDQERVDPDVPILFPGEPELITRAQRLAHGIPLGIHLVEIFADLARELGLPWRR